MLYLKEAEQALELANTSELTVLVPNCSQNNVVNPFRSFYSFFLTDQPKKIIMVSTRKTRYWRSAPQDKVTSRLDPDLTLQ